MAQVQPNEVSKEMFMAELRAARKRAGSVFKLSLAIEHHPRCIANWLAGKGPRYGLMQELYYVLQRVGRKS